MDHHLTVSCLESNPFKPKSSSKAKIWTVFFKWSYTKKTFLTLSSKICFFQGSVYISVLKFSNEALDDEV